MYTNNLDKDYWSPNLLIEWVKISNSLDTNMTFYGKKTNFVIQGTEAALQVTKMLFQAYSEASSLMAPSLEETQC